MFGPTTGRWTARKRTVLTGHGSRQVHSTSRRPLAPSQVPYPLRIPLDSYFELDALAIPSARTS